MFPERRGIGSAARILRAAELGTPEVPHLAAVLHPDIAKASKPYPNSEWPALLQGHRTSCERRTASYRHR
jgi:hypothetical protein